MTPESVIELFRQALQIIVLMVTVIVGPGLVVGLIVSMFQAATQINEQTMSFLPRLIVTLFAVIVAAPWLSQLVIDFTIRLYSEIHLLIG